MIKRSGKRCKKNCTAYNAALIAADKLHHRCKELTAPAENYTSLAALADEGFLILGINSVRNHSVVTVLRLDGGSHRKVQLYYLPYNKFSHPICDMDIEYKENSHSTYIIDWHSKFENEGYGSILMSNLISYLKMAGFHYLTGVISHVDFDHEDKLRHFYQKFGFEIINYPDKRALRLELK